MILELATVVALARQCAPSVAAETLVSLVHTESKFDPNAIGVNAKGVRAPAAADKASAIAAAKSLIARGYNIDLGLGQINSANLRWLGLSVEDTFDPCRNLAAAARVLATNYTSVARPGRSTNDAIATAMSMYNTGSRSAGFRNGYVRKVYTSSSIIVPAMRGGAAVVVPAPIPSPPEPAQSREPLSMTETSADAAAPSRNWDTAADAQTASLLVFGAPANISSKGQ